MTTAVTITISDKGAVTITAPEMPNIVVTGLEDDVISDYLSEDDPRWEEHTGSERYIGKQFSVTSQRALSAAQKLWDSLSANGRAFLGVLCDHPAELLTASEVCKLSKGALATKYTIAGTINGFVHPCESVGYALPFLPFQRFGEETSYAIRQSVADAFNKVRRA